VKKQVILEKKIYELSYALNQQQGEIIILVLSFEFINRGELVDRNDSTRRWQIVL